MFVHYFESTPRRDAVPMVEARADASRGRVSYSAHFLSASAYLLASSFSPANTSCRSSTLQPARKHIHTQTDTIE